MMSPICFELMYQLRGHEKQAKETDRNHGHTGNNAEYRKLIGAN
jgi:hypothetical protein